MRRGIEGRRREPSFELIEPGPRAPLVAVRRRQEKASRHEFEVQTRGRRAPEIGQCLGDDIGCASEFGSPEGRGLRLLDGDLIFRSVDEAELGSTRHVLQHDEIAQPLEEIGGEATRLVPSLHHLVDDGEQGRTVVLRNGVDRLIEEGGIGHPELLDRGRVGHAVGTGP